MDYNREYMTRSVKLISNLIFLSCSAFAQDVPFTVSSITLKGGLVASEYTNTISATGTATVVGLGDAAIVMSGIAARERGFNCANFEQFSIKFNFTPTDSLTAQFVAPPLTGPSLTAKFNAVSTTGFLLAGRGGNGTINLTIQVAADGTFNATGSAAGTLTTKLVPVATIQPSGIVPVYSSVPVVQPGSWFSIYGSNFTGTTSVWNNDFPTSLGGVTVTVNGRPAYLWFVSPGQINVQAPDDRPNACAEVVVTTQNGIVKSGVTLNTSQPSFNLLDSKYAAVVILTPDGSGAYGGGTYDLAGPVGQFPYPTRPVKVGETVSLYGVGFGPTSQIVPAGLLFPGPATQLLSYPGVTIGGVRAQVSFAGLVGAGLYQINLIMPPLPSGDQVLSANVGGGVPLGPGAGNSPGGVYIPVK